MRGIFTAIVVTAVMLCAVGAWGQNGQSKKGGDKAVVSFKNDVAPVIKKHCLPCHAEDNFNPSELSLDTYNDLMTGGKHGVPVVAGKPAESILIQKLSARPPFGDQMPLARKNSSKPPDKLSTQELDTIRKWIEQGAKDN